MIVYAYFNPIIQNEDDDETPVYRYSGILTHRDGLPHLCIITCEGGLHDPEIISSLESVLVDYGNFQVTFSTSGQSVSVASYSDEVHYHVTNSKGISIKHL